MKKIATLLLVMMLGIVSIQAKDYYHDASVLPTAATVILNKNFKADVSLVKVDKDFGRISEYEVILRDGTEVTFDRSGNWTEIQTANNKSVPDSMVPAAIRQYVKDHQGKCRIVGIEKNRRDYDVELSNGVDMKFDLQGRFLRYDD